MHDCRTVLSCLYAVPAYLARVHDHCRKRNSFYMANMDGILCRRKRKRLRLPQAAEELMMKHRSLHMVQSAPLWAGRHSGWSIPHGSQPLTCLPGREQVGHAGALEQQYHLVVCSMWCPVAQGKCDVFCASFLFSTRMHSLQLQPIGPPWLHRIAY